MRLYRNFLPNTSVSAPSGTRKNIPRLSPSKFLRHFAGTPWTLSCVWFQKTIQMQCRWFAASSEVAKTAFGHSQKHTAAIPLKVPSSLCGDPVDIILRVVSKNNSNAVPVVCRLFRGGKNRLRALAKTYRGSSLHFAAAPFFPPRSLAFTQAQATATAETPHGDEMKRTAARAVLARWCRWWGSNPHGVSTSGF